MGQRRCCPLPLPRLTPLACSAPELRAAFLTSDPHNLPSLLIDFARASLASPLPPGRSEKEVLKAMQAQEKKAMRLRQREAAVTGPKDDAAIEWDGLLARYRAAHG